MEKLLDGSQVIGWSAWLVMRRGRVYKPPCVDLFLINLAISGLQLGFVIFFLKKVKLVLPVEALLMPKVA